MIIKRRMLLGLVCLIMLITFVYADNFACKYDSQFDLDGDYAMNKKSNCGSDYIYDCDDSNSEKYKDCGNGFFGWFKSLFIKSDEKPTGILKSTITKKLTDITPKGNIITGGVVIDNTRSAVVDSSDIIKFTYVFPSASEKNCKILICKDSKGKEYVCPDNLKKCSSYYASCRLLDCEKEQLVNDSAFLVSTTPVASDTEKSIVKKETVTDSISMPVLTTTVELNELTSNCVEKDNTCYTETGKQVVCRGEFENCDVSFYNCTCGIDDSVYSSSIMGLKSITSSNTNILMDNCTTRQYVCKTTSSTYNTKQGSVICKGSLNKCSQMYENCECDDSETNWFSSETCAKTEHLCQDSRDNFIHCYGTFNYCNKKYYNTCECGFNEKKCEGLTVNTDVCDADKNQCVKSDGLVIQISGSLSFCEKKCAGNCICGIEQVK